MKQNIEEEETHFADAELDQVGKKCNLYITFVHQLCRVTGKVWQMSNRPNP